jgi:hypothetical protein
MEELHEVEDAVASIETPDALLVSAPVFDQSQWIPKSQIDDSSDIHAEDDAGVLVVTMWLARERGWV